MMFFKNPHSNRGDSKYIQSSNRYFGRYNLIKNIKQKMFPDLGGGEIRIYKKKDVERFIRNVLFYNPYE